MAQSVVSLLVKDNGFNATIKRAISTFASLGNAANSAKGQMSKFADGIAKVAQSQELLNTALKGNPYGMMAQAATMAFTKVIEYATKASDAEIRMAEEAEMKAERQKAANEAIGRSTGELMAKYELLRIQWNNLSNDQQRNEWIKANKSAFNSLNIAVTDVTSAENVFVNNTAQVVAALKARAEAEAYAELYKEQIKKNAMNKATGAYNVPQVGADYKPSRSEAQIAGLTSEDYEYRRRKVHNRYGEEGYITESTGRLTQSGVDKINRVRQMGQASLENADNMQANYWANKMAEAQSNAAALSNNSLFGSTSGGGGGRGGKVTVPVKPVYVPEEGTPDYIKAMISDLQSKLGKEKDSELRTGILMDIKALQEEYKSMTSLPGVGEEMADDFEVALGPLQQLEYELQQLKKDLETAPNTEAYQAGLQAIADKEKEINKFKGVAEIGNDAKDTSKSFQQAAGAIGQVGSALNSIEDPSAKIVGIVAQAIATIAQGFANATTSSSSGGIFAWIASLAAGSAAMLSAIGTIHSATGYANGGVVKGYAGGGTITGNSYSGDNIGGIVDGSQFVGLNAGELVLSRAQTSSLASQLKGNGGASFQPYVTGEFIFLGANNHTRASGQGEIVTTGMLRNMGLIH